MNFFSSELNKAKFTHFFKSDYTVDSKTISKVIGNCNFRRLWKIVRAQKTEDFERYRKNVSFSVWFMQNFFNTSPSIYITESIPEEIDSFDAIFC